MLYGFQVVPTLQCSSEPAKLFFDRLQAEAARVATRNTGITQEEAMQLCEFLDAVDSRAVSAARNVYQACLSRLFDYLESASPGEARQLASRSWAADTCLSLCDNTFIESDLRHG